MHPRFGRVGNVAAVSLAGVWHGSRRLAELRALPASNECFDAVDIRDIRPAGGPPAANRVELDLVSVRGGPDRARAHETDQA